jgi:hypothetical protein
VSDFGRRAPRFDRKLDVSIGVFDVRRRCQTTNVSRHGVHLNANPGVPIGKMVWLHIQLPTDTGVRMVEATAVVRPGPPDREGAGLEFSMFLRGSRRLWEDYIRDLEGARGEERRIWPRRDISFLVRLSQNGEAINTEDISGSGMRIATAQPIAIGTEADLLLIHPHTEQVFEVKAKVVRHIHEDGRLCALGLEFVDLSDEIRDDLLDFSITGELPTEQFEDPEDAEE